MKSFLFRKFQLTWLSILHCSVTSINVIEVRNVKKKKCIISYFCCIFRRNVCNRKCIKTRYEMWLLVKTVSGEHFATLGNILRMWRLFFLDWGFTVLSIFLRKIITFLTRRECINPFTTFKSCRLSILAILMKTIRRWRHFSWLGFRTLTRLFLIYLGDR